MFLENVAGAHIFHVQLVLPESLVVAGVRKQLSIVGNHHRSQRHERFVLRQVIHVQQNLFLACRTLRRPALPAVHLVLLAFLGALVVPVIAIAKRNRNVGLFNVAPHLLVELLLQILGTVDHVPAPGVFRLEVRHHLGTLFFPQPRVVVHQRVSVDRPLRMPARRHWRARGYLTAPIAHLFSRFCDFCTAVHQMQARRRRHKQSSSRLGREEQGPTGHGLFPVPYCLFPVLFYRPATA